MCALGRCRAERWSSFWTEGRRFCANTDWSLELVTIAPTLTKAPVPTEEKQPQSMMLPLHLHCSYAVIVVMCTVGFVPNIHFGILSQMFSFVFFREILDVFLQNEARLGCFSLWDEASVLPSCPIAQTHEEHQRLLSRVCSRYSQILLHFPQYRCRPLGSLPD